MFLLTLLFTCVIGLFSYYYWHMTYWSRRSIAEPAGKSLMFGHFYTIFDNDHPIMVKLGEWSKVIFTLELSDFFRYYDFVLNLNSKHFDILKYVASFEGYSVTGYEWLIVAFDSSLLRYFEFERKNCRSTARRSVCTRVSERCSSRATSTWSTRCSWSSSTISTAGRRIRWPAIRARISEPTCSSPGVRDGSDSERLPPLPSRMLTWRR